ncbi:UDP-N-acetylglucosamine 2-epimerase (non-hydrolyzing) [Desulfoluna limicola]|uniref:UDP-N-acetylglucosamine 2-epimerase (Non-hydrolyzing) n=1 Tax=Desulfoluna limicola TaxID=2810562 RepID=A0ABN6EZI9_9BACT|nr:UDP-N-acetylglucosamine 2-epimerase [Desulfoluna limicola]BCS94660.1 UDP-N-acetylglucosamine 2-epimerase (non-hydrolyzing) [Desulfoluna limicola]
MIHFFIGTKAQFIKMAPVIEEVSEHGWDYSLIDTKQHAKTTSELINLFNLRYPDVVLSNRKENIKKLADAILWFIKDIIRLVLFRKKIAKSVFQGRGGVCVVHGDTLTTLLSILYAKRCGLKIVHIESGLRSYDLFNPFPEEIIRLISMKLSDSLIAPSSQAYNNLVKMGYSSKSVFIKGNTGKDAALKIVQSPLCPDDFNVLPRKNYVAVTIHRAENIYNYQRMKLLCEAVKYASKDKNVVFVLHDPTQIQLLKYNLLGELQANKNVLCIGLQPYDKFIQLLLNAECVMTDGGSIQEECSYFNIPCIVLRSSTERDDGIGKNAILAKYDLNMIKSELNKMKSLKLERPHPLLERCRPSEKIAELLHKISQA